MYKNEDKTLDMDWKLKSNFLSYPIYKVILSKEPYFRLSVPPGIWFGFKGLSSDLNLICNVSNIPHDTYEVLRKEVNQIDITWSIEWRLLY